MTSKRSFVTLSEKFSARGALLSIEETLGEVIRRNARSLIGFGITRSLLSTDTLENNCLNNYRPDALKIWNLHYRVHKTVTLVAVRNEVNLYIRIFP